MNEKQSLRDLDRLSSLPWFHKGEQMFSYIMLGTNDLSRAITFYDPLMDILAYPRGGTDEGAPGLRPHFGEGFYSAYVRDPDGNKLAFVYYTAQS
jgi:catechol 2,3-dioxygenase-like lactoylglutathione lyase family enzyme